MFIQKWLGLLLLVSLTGCGEDAFPPTGGAVVSSQHGARISHTDERRGQNCMNCHKAGSDISVFTVAGTVYQSNLTTVYPDATINFYSEPAGAGSLIDSFDVDGNGNFYTTKVMDFTVNVFPSIEGAANETPRYMTDAIVQGDCNSCHGNSTLPITIG